MEDDPLLALAQLEAALSSDRPSLKPSGVARRPEEARRLNDTIRPAPAARASTFPGMIPVSQSDLQNIAAAAPAMYTDQRTVRPLPPPVVRGNSNTLFRPGATNAKNNSKYGNGDAMTLPSSSRGYKDLGQGSLIKKHTGLNVKNPLVSSSQLEARLDAQSVIKLKDIVNRNSVGMPKTWATLAVVGEISARKEDAQGRPFSIWKLTDLSDTLITLFLFGNAYTDCHRDARPGAMVALFSPKIRSEGGSFSLSISSGDSMLELGSATEFGFCKSKTKSGQPCRAPVNTKVCEFCSLHVQKEYNILRSKRIELQGNSLKSAFQQGMKGKTNWNPGQFQSLNAVARPKLPAITSQQLKEAAAVAASRAGTSSGARYIKTVADPDGARTTAQEMETSRLRNNTLDPKAAPIPLARVSKVVMQDPLPARKRRGGGSGKSGSAVEESKRARTGGEVGKKDDDDMVELEDDDIFGDEMPLGPPAAPAAAAEAVPAPQRQQVGEGGGSRSDALTRRAPVVPPPRAAAVPPPRAAPPPPAASRRPPPPARASADPTADITKQRAIEILKSKKTNPTSTFTLQNPTTRIPDFLMNGIVRQEEEKAQQLQQEEEEEEVELDDDEEDEEDFTIAAKHNTTVAAGTGGRSSNTNFSTVAGNKFFGPGGSRYNKLPSGTRTGIIPGLGKATKTKPGNSTKPGKTYFANTNNQGTARGGGNRKATTGNGPAKTGFAAAFGSVIAEMERAEAENPANTTSKGGSLYQDIVDQQDTEDIFNLMGVLEKKDNMATKMDSIKTLNVTAWRCEVCSSLTEYRPKACGEAHPHALSKLQAIKRWWQCGGCKGRFHTLGVRYPTSKCPKCDVLGTDFIQVSMLRPQKKLDHEMQQSQVASRDLLVARGAEQKWVNQ